MIAEQGPGPSFHDKQETVKGTLGQHSKGPFQVNVNWSWNAKGLFEKVCYQGLIQQEKSPAFVSVVWHPHPGAFPWGLVHFLPLVVLVGSAQAVWFSSGLPGCTLPRVCYVLGVNCSWSHSATLRKAVLPPGMLHSQWDSFS